MSHGITHGFKHGATHGISRGGFTSKDATSGKYVPQTASEFTGAGFAAPTQIWRLQEAAAPFADSVSSANLTVNGTVTPQTAVSGWSQVGIAPTGGGANYVFNNSSGTLGTGHDPITYLIYVAITSVPAGDTDVTLIGDSNGPKLIATVSTGKRIPKIVLNAVFSSVSTTGSSDLLGTVHPWLYTTDGGNTPTFSMLYTDLEALSVTPSNVVSSLPQIFIGGVIEVAPAMTVLGAWQWVGTSMTTTTVRSLYRALGWSPVW